jgi:hypothetical protein
LQLAAVQHTPLLQLPLPAQSRVHELPAQRILPSQLPVPEHVMSQLAACVQSIGPPHDPTPMHSTRHGTPVGHVTLLVHELTPEQSITQTPRSQTPTPAQAVAQSPTGASLAG